MATLLDTPTDTVIEYPNRDKARSKLVKLIVVGLLLASTVVIVIVSLGGWEATREARPGQIVFAALYVLLAFYIARWRSGMLPVAAALATLLALFAAVAAPQWLARDQAGFASPPLEGTTLGVLAFAIVGLQLAIIVFAMAGFRQRWSVEVERRPDGSRRGVARTA
ncbi:MAG TPA: hypothetical protein VGV40_03080 [Solirubrobacteraceae bacterium]|nr:hypothetical protein [Solirubrobacteraceae bacterium]